MPSAGVRRWIIITGVVLLILIVGGGLGFRIAVQALQGKVAEALGAGGEISGLNVTWSGVEVTGLRIKSLQGWPATDALRAERVFIVPSLRSFLSDQIVVGAITVVKPYLSALRTRDGGLRVLPSLLERSATKGLAETKGPARTVTISRIALEDAIVELFDATVAQPPLKIRLEQIQASVRNVVVATLTRRSRFDLTGVVKGIHQDGRITVTGWAEGASKDSSVKVQLRSVDLVALQPYFVAAGEPRLQKGTLDLDLHSEVQNKRLRAPGKLVIADLTFAAAGGRVGTFMGVPRAAAVNFLKDKQSTIAVNFVIEGDLDNPRFSLNESFATRVASALAEKLGVSFRGLAGGVEDLGRKALGAGGATAEGVERTFKQLLGGQR